ncbi:SAM-dependent methyltransferase [Kitasatospora sp. NPDC059327]|uniref:SAM-dependent methyltransferase n=1 Tax=Kitasatospora sp. NPDC059327 TaxID=3346803 RepID=UPI003686A619
MTATGDIGAYYDALTPVLRQLWGDNFHIGLWPDDTEPAEPAADRMAAVTAAGDRLTDLLLRELRPRSGQKFLDMGCGIGRPALRLARSTGSHVTGITISTTQVALATARAEAAGLGDRARFQHADATCLPFTDHSYDAAWAIESLLHIADTRKALTELHRVLAPGSPFAVSDMILRGSDTGRHAHSSITPVGTLLVHLAETGYHVEKIIDLDAQLHRSLQHLEADLARHHDELRAAHGDQAVDALSRILRKTVPHVGSVFGYVVITARAIPVPAPDTTARPR